jgi:hypothetical protein
MIDVGDIYQVARAIRDDDGALVNPVTATLTITLPDLTTVTPAVPLPPAETGILRVDFPTTVGGLHRWRLVTTAPVTATADAFNVADSSWQALVGLAEVKAHLNIPATDTTDDEELRGFILSASAVVEDIVGVCAPRTIVETNSGGSRHFVLSHRPVLAVTTVEADGVAVDAGDYTVSPSGLIARRSGAWPAGLHNLEVTYVAGRVQTTPNVLDATLELIRINWRPQQGGNYSPFDGGAGDDFGVTAGAEASLQGALRLGFFVPNTVTQRLQPDQRGPIVL